mmetsp:Transcript_76584/g.212746  ORF Transcript_76584/g.212746 Transcript_76584/m.212746 type:complete len:240 (-) Transcript_76584:119-838(-)
MDVYADVFPRVLPLPARAEAWPLCSLRGCCSHHRVVAHRCRANRHFRLLPATHGDPWSAALWRCARGVRLVGARCHPCHPCHPRLICGARRLGNRLRHRRRAAVTGLANVAHADGARRTQGHSVRRRVDFHQFRPRRCAATFRFATRQGGDGKIGGGHDSGYCRVLVAALPQGRDGNASVIFDHRRHSLASMGRCGVYAPHDSRSCGAGCWVCGRASFHLAGKSPEVYNAWSCCTSVST